MDTIRMIAKIENNICAERFEREGVVSAALACLLFLEIFPVIFYSLI